MKNSLGQSIRLLPAEERATFYRAAAAHAFKCADGVTDSVLRTQYLQLATSWHDLAEEIQRSLDVLNKPADLEAKPILRS